MNVFKLAVLGLLAGGTAMHAGVVNLTFTQLTGVTGGTPAATGVWRADLSSIPFSISSIAIQDSNSGIGGSPGQFSGFDLDGIKLSTVLITDATNVNGLAEAAVFDFSTAGTLFSPGTQRLPTDPKLFGTGPTGSTIDNGVATLGNFDGNSTTGPTAYGFVSLGDGGKVIFNLPTSITPAGTLYLYIGEVGDNGEVAAGTITVSDQPGTVPDGSATVGLLGLAVAGLAAMRRFIS